MQVFLSIAFFLGLILKLLHVPYHTVYLLVVVGTGLTMTLFHMVRTEEKRSAVAILASWSWCFHLVALLKLFPFRNLTLMSAFGCTLIAALLYWRDFRWDRPLQVLTGIFILAMLVMARPTPERYRFTNLTFSLERGTDVHSWDKYSFLLLREGDVRGALEANRSAVEAAHASGRIDLLPVLESRAKTIESGDWPIYGSLPH